MLSRQKDQGECLNFLPMLVPLEDSRKARTPIWGEFLESLWMCSRGQSTESHTILDCSTVSGGRNSKGRPQVAIISGDTSHMQRSRGGKGGYYYNSRSTAQAYPGYYVIAARAIRHHPAPHGKEEAQPGLRLVTIFHSTVCQQHSMGPRH